MIKFIRKAPPIQILRVRPGDVVVAHIEDRLSMAEVDRIGIQLKRAFSDRGIRVVVAERLRFEVCRPEDRIEHEKRPEPVVKWHYRETLPDGCRAEGPRNG